MTAAAEYGDLVTACLSLISQHTMKSDKTSSKIGQRLWSRDVSLWVGEADEQAAIANRLGWLDAPVWLRSQINGLVSWGDEVRAAGFDRAVVLGMGGSSLAAEVIARIFGQGPGGLALTVLDNTHPDAVRAVLESGHLNSTLFLVASKSGTTLEANVFLATFFEALRQKIGADAGKHFVVITDANTPLARRAANEGFRHCFINPGDIGGRYSALTFFGMVPAALLGLDLSSLCDGAEAALADAHLFEAGEDNSALNLGLFLGHWAGRGRDKLSVLLSPALAPLSVWIEQLIAESTGKRGVGIVPVADAPVPLDAYGTDRLFVAVGLACDVDLTQRCQAIKAAGHPVHCHSLTSTESLVGEFFRWEFATAVAGSLLGINPFDEPDVTVSKNTTTALLQGQLETDTTPWVTLIDEAGIRVDGRRAGSADTGALASSLRGFLTAVQPGDYVALLAYLPGTPQHETAMAALANQVRSWVRAPVTVNMGPRYLHSTGQLHKGGPATGVFVIITVSADSDIAIPGEAFGFGQLNLAQAEGDYRVLAGLDRRVIRVHLSCPMDMGLEKLSACLETDAMASG
ncbi:MAG: hypothetical protein P8J24_10890 [Arenicellales bacterium]|nr:hypothetical protein [Arenicellales bacterium]